MFFIRYRKAWSTHMPMLIACVERTTGPILEIGCGIFSSPYLHWKCYRDKRLLVSYENSLAWYERHLQFEDSFHEVNFVENWDDMNVKGPWSVAFVDHAPEERRRVDIARLADCADLIVAHDCEERQAKYYQYEKIYPLFKYRYHFDDLKRQTVVLSNKDDLTWLS